MNGEFKRKQLATDNQTPGHLRPPRSDLRAVALFIGLANRRVFSWRIDYTRQNLPPSGLACLTRASPIPHRSTHCTYLTVRAAESILIGCRHSVRRSRIGDSRHSNMISWAERSRREPSSATASSIPSILRYCLG